MLPRRASLGLWEGLALTLRWRQSFDFGGENIFWIPPFYHHGKLQSFLLQVVGLLRLREVIKQRMGCGVGRLAQALDSGL